MTGLKGDGIWIGADPGGKGNFGLAFLQNRLVVQLICVDCADQAIDAVLRFEQLPLGVGIDAPLWWSSGPSGDRRADQWIRRTFSLSGGQVQAANSLRGAALVQGMMFAHLMRERFPKVPITESHPNAVLRALGQDWESFREAYLDRAQYAVKHERDAIISAVSAREGFLGNWPVDLARKRHSSEQDPERFWLAPINYYWPETRR